MRSGKSLIKENKPEVMSCCRDKRRNGALPLPPTHTTPRTASSSQNRFLSILSFTILELENAKFSHSRV